MVAQRCKAAGPPLDGRPGDRRWTQRSGFIFCRGQTSGPGATEGRATCPPAGESGRGLEGRGGMSIRVLLVDHQALLRHGIKLILQPERDIEVVGEAADGGEAVDRAVALSPDVVLIETMLPGGDGAATIRAIKQRCPRTQVVVLSGQGDQETFSQTAEAGAAGYILKDISPENLVNAIRAAHTGRTILSPTIAAQIVRHLALTDDGAGTGDHGGIGRQDVRLTQHEIEVLTRVARGLSDKEIGAQLFLAESTVKSRLRRLYLKLGLKNRSQAAVFALERGLLTVVSDDRRTSTRPRHRQM